MTRSSLALWVQTARSASAYAALATPCSSATFSAVLMRAFHACLIPFLRTPALSSAASSSPASTSASPVGSQAAASRTYSARDPYSSRERVTALLASIKAWAAASASATASALLVCSAFKISLSARYLFPASSAAAATSPF